MSPTPAWDWTILATASTLAFLAAFALIVSLLYDRPRGRTRCPRCWYDMSGVTRADQLTCPECGKQIKSERSLRKTRRRWRYAIPALLILLPSGYTVSRTLAILDHGWPAAIPTPVLIFTADSEAIWSDFSRPGGSDDWSLKHVMRRIRTPEARVWHHRLIAWRMNRYCEANGLGGRVGLYRTPQLDWIAPFIEIDDSQRLELVVSRVRSAYLDRGDWSASWYAGVFYHYGSDESHEMLTRIVSLLRDPSRLGAAPAELREGLHVRMFRVEPPAATEGGPLSVSSRRYTHQRLTVSSLNPASPIHMPLMTHLGRSTEPRDQETLVIFLGAHLIAFGPTGELENIDAFIRQWRPE